MILSLIISAWFGEKFIKYMKRRNISEVQRDASIDPFGVEKKGVPTMGGIIIIVSILLPVLLLGRMRNIYLILMIVTRTLNNLNSDIFSLAWSISQLMATVGTFQVRMYQATDVSGKYDFRQYFLFRVFCLIIMIISSCAYVVYLKYNFYKSLIIVLICIFKAIDCFADVYEGWFQQKERLDLSGKAQTARVIA